MIELLKQPWPWYVGGPLIGLTVPALLLLTNRTFGISSSFRHVCAATFPGDLQYLKYDWKKELWNLFFVAGILLGGLVVNLFFTNPMPMEIHDSLAQELARAGISDHSSLLPVEIFSWNGLLTAKGLIMIAAGGFLVGFGTRYAGGCTSGHSIMGLANLQFGSLVATICFMLGGFLMANLALPYILNL